MEPFIESVVKSCFPNDNTILPSIIISELKEPCQQHVKSLTFMCIREVMKSRLRAKPAREDILKLIFQEPIDIVQASNIPFDGNKQLKNDAGIMQLVLDRNFVETPLSTIEMSITEKELRVKMDRDLIVEAVHDNSIACSMQLALDFARIAFKKGVYFIEIFLEALPELGADRMGEVFDDFIRKTGLISPEDASWNEAVQREDHLHYRSYSKLLDNFLSVSQIFVQEPPLDGERLDRYRVYVP